MHYIIVVLLLSALLSALIGLQAYLKSRGGYENEHLENLGKALISFRVFEIICSVSIAVVGLNFLIELYNWGQKVVNLAGYNPFIPLIIAAICLALGLGAYTIRCRFRLTYGSVEVAVGIVAAYRTIGPHDTSTILQLAAGVYIIVRGLDNIEKSLKKRPGFRNRWIGVFGSPD